MPVVWIMAMPVISAQNEEISYNESASYSVEGDFNGTTKLTSHYGSQRNSGQAQRLVRLSVKFCERRKYMTQHDGECS